MNTGHRPFLPRFEIRCELARSLWIASLANTGVVGEAMQHGSRAAVLRTSEQTALLRLRARTKYADAPRDPRPRCSRRRSAGGADETSSKTELIRRQSFRRIRRRRPLPANIAASDARDQTQRAQRVRQSTRAPDGIRTHAGAGLSRLPLPFGLRGPATMADVILMLRSTSGDVQAHLVDDDQPRSALSATPPRSALLRQRPASLECRLAICSGRRLECGPR